MFEEDNAPLEETNQRRRELLNVMKNVAIAGPILLTLKNTPALAQVIVTASCMSANISGHDHPGLGDDACEDTEFQQESTADTGS